MYYIVLEKTIAFETYFVYFCGFDYEFDDENGEEFSLLTSLWRKWACAYEWKDRAIGVTEELELYLKKRPMRSETKVKIRVISSDDAKDSFAEEK